MTEQPELKPTQAARNANEGHGHVFLRPDGVRMRCGGPGMCKECAKDLASLQSALSPQPPLSPQEAASDLDEVYDTQRTVEQDPCGAFMAIQSQAARIERLEAALREFVNRCERGEIRSKKTYAKFKALLAKLEKEEGK